jgi:regulator of replication initiation timing
LDLNQRISTREQLDLLISKYEIAVNVNIECKRHIHDLSKKVKSLQKAYSEIRSHCHLVEEDKRALLEHAKWQEEHIILLQKDIKELTLCNSNANSVISQLKKEGTVMQVALAEKSMIADATLQAEVKSLKLKLENEIQQRAKAFGIITELRKGLKRSDKSNLKWQVENDHLRSAIAQYESRFDKMATLSSAANEAAERAEHIIRTPAFVEDQYQREFRSRSMHPRQSTVS